MTTIHALQGDITQLDVDAIVNAANSALLGGGGVDGAIHRAAGPELLAECRGLNGCMTGFAKFTEGYRLPSRYVIHTVGPIWKGGAHQEDQLLRSCYQQCLLIAKQLSVSRIAFPAISCGVYGYPHEQAVNIACEEVTQFCRLEPSIKEVIFCCFDAPMLVLYQTKLTSK